jgi:hypothetical protein
MTKTTTTAKSKTKRMPGKERPAASRLGIQGPPTPEPHPRNTSRNKKPSDSQPTGPTAEGLDYRFLRSQPRVIGHGSLRKARPRQSDTHHIKHAFEGSILALQTCAAAR